MYAYQAGPLCMLSFRRGKEGKTIDAVSNAVGVPRDTDRAEGWAPTYLVTAQGEASRAVQCVGRLPMLGGMWNTAVGRHRTTRSHDGQKRHAAWACLDSIYPCFSVGCWRVPRGWGLASAIVRLWIAWGSSWGWLDRREVKMPSHQQPVYTWSTRVPPFS